MVKLALLACLLIACESNIDKMRKLKDEACACTDDACAKAVTAKIDALVSSIKQPDPDEVEAFTKLVAESITCRH
jgi:hypothetical protein